VVVGVVGVVVVVVVVVVVHLTPLPSFGRTEGRCVQPPSVVHPHVGPLCSTRVTFREDGEDRRFAPESVLLEIIPPSQEPLPPPPGFLSPS